MASFKWKLKTLPFGSQAINYHVEGDFFNEAESADIVAACIDVTALVNRKEENYFEFSFRCTGTVTIPCDRCLAPMTLEVDTTYAVSATQQGDVLDDSGDGQLFVPESWHELDVAPIIRDTVLLSIPLTHTHAPGECDPIVMEKLRQLEVDGHTHEGDDDVSQPVDPRWDALRKIKNEQ